MTTRPMINSGIPIEPNTFPPNGLSAGSHATLYAFRPGVDQGLRYRYWSRLRGGRRSCPSPAQRSRPSARGRGSRYSTLWRRRAGLPGRRPGRPEGTPPRCQAPPLLRPRRHHPPSSELLLLLPLLGLCLLAVDLTHEGWYLFVLRGGLASSLQYLYRLVIAARGVIEDGEVLYLLGVLGVLFQGLLGSRDLLVGSGAWSACCCCWSWLPSTSERLWLMLVPRPRKIKERRRKARADGRRPHPEAQSIAVHHHGCLSSGVFRCRDDCISCYLRRSWPRLPRRRPLRNTRSGSPSSCEVSITARSAHFPPRASPFGLDT